MPLKKTKKKTCLALFFKLLYTLIHVHTYIHTYIYAYIYSYRYTHTYIHPPYTHTHTHTYIYIYIYMEFQRYIFYCCFLFDSILGDSILTPRYLAGLASWIWRLQGIIRKKKIVKDRRRRYLLYFSFISGFNNHSVDEEILPEYKRNGWISQSRC